MSGPQSSRSAGAQSARLEWRPCPSPVSSRRMAGRRTVGPRAAGRPAQHARPLARPRHARWPWRAGLARRRGLGGARGILELGPGSLVVAALGGWAIGSLLRQALGPPLLAAALGGLAWLVGLTAHLAAGHGRAARLDEVARRARRRDTLPGLAGAAARAARGGGTSRHRRRGRLDGAARRPQGRIGRAAHAPADRSAAHHGTGRSAAADSPTKGMPSSVTARRLSAARPSSRPPPRGRRPPPRRRSWAGRGRRRRAVPRAATRGDSGPSSPRPCAAARRTPRSRPAGRSRVGSIWRRSPSSMRRRAWRAYWSRVMTPIIGRHERSRRRWLQDGSAVTGAGRRWRVARARPSQPPAARPRGGPRGGRASRPRRRPAGPRLRRRSTPRDGGRSSAVPGPGTEVRPDSIFFVASVTKAIVATALMRYVDEGRLDLHAPLATLPARLPRRRPRGHQRLARPDPHLGPARHGHRGHAPRAALLRPVVAGVRAATPAWPPGQPLRVQLHRPGCCSRRRWLASRRCPSPGPSNGASPARWA